VPVTRGGAGGEAKGTASAKRELQGYLRADPPRILMTMRSLLLVALFALGACHKDTPPAAAPPPDNTGGVVETGGKLTCASDDDCVVSCVQRENCCDQLCKPCRQAYHRDELAEIEAWRTGAACAATSCPVARCMAPAETVTARCVAGACTAEATPLQK